MIININIIKTIMINIVFGSLIFIICYIDLYIMSNYGFSLLSIISFSIIAIIYRIFKNYYNNKFARIFFIEACEKKEANDFYNAEISMLKAISLFTDPKFKTMGFHNLGNWNLKSNKTASQNYYEKAIACDPENYKPHVGIGWLFMTINKLDKALNYSILSIKLINKSKIDIDTKNKALGNVMNNIALIYHKQFIGGDKSCKDLAEKYYKQSIELNVEVELMTECLDLLQNGDDIKFIDIYSKLLGIWN